MKLFYIAALCLILAACGTSQATLTQKVAQAEAAFTSAISIVNDARRPCKLNGEDAPGCYIKAATYNELVPIVHGTNDALARAKKFAIANQLDESETWLDTAERLLETMMTKYVKPVKELLGL